MAQRHRLGDDLQAFIASGRPVLGICNGFQVLVKAGLLPGLNDALGTMNPGIRTHRSSFIILPPGHPHPQRLRPLRVPLGLSAAAGRQPVYVHQGLTEPIYCPVAHGEGKFVARDLVDTKYEFGLIDGKLALIDEVHTPDSSRFWVLDSYERTRPCFDTPQTATQPTATRPTESEPESFDKEFLRLCFVAQGYRGDGPPPAMPPEFIAQVAPRYIAAYERLTGLPFAPAAQPAAERIWQALARQS